MPSMSVAKKNKTRTTVGVAPVTARLHQRAAAVGLYTGRFFRHLLVLLVIVLDELSFESKLVAFDAYSN